MLSSYVVFLLISKISVYIISLNRMEIRILFLVLKAENASGGYIGERRWFTGSVEHKRSGYGNGKMYSSATRVGLPRLSFGDLCNIH